MLALGSGSCSTCTIYTLSVIASSGFHTGFFGARMLCVQALIAVVVYGQSRMVEVWSYHVQQSREGTAKAYMMCISEWLLSFVAIFSRCYVTIDLVHELQDPPTLLENVEKLRVALGLCYIVKDWSFNMSGHSMSWYIEGYMHVISIINSMAKGTIWVIIPRVTVSAITVSETVKSRSESVV